VRDWIQFAHIEEFAWSHFRLKLFLDLNFLPSKRGTNSPNNQIIWTYIPTHHAVCHLHENMQHVIDVKFRSSKLLQTERGSNSAAAISQAVSGFDLLISRAYIIQDVAATNKMQIVTNVQQSTLN
jgi:hypothetical protein